MYIHTRIIPMVESHDIWNEVLIWSSPIGYYTSYLRSWSFVIGLECIQKIHSLEVSSSKVDSFHMWFFFKYLKTRGTHNFRQIAIMAHKHLFLGVVLMLFVFSKYYYALRFKLGTEPWKGSTMYVRSRLKYSEMHYVNDVTIYTFLVYISCFLY